MMRRTRHLLIRCSFSTVIILAAFPGCASARTSNEETAGVHRTGPRVTKATYEDWRLSRGLKPEKIPAQADLEKIYLTKVLAEAAIANGLSQSKQTQLRLQYAQDKILAKALQRELTETIKFSEEQLRAAFDGNPRNRYKPKKYRLREIYLKKPSTVSEEGLKNIRAEAENVLKRIKAGEDFSDLAREISDSQTRVAGGYVGVVDPAVLAPELREAVEKLQENSTTPVLETPSGFVILHCDLIVPEKKHSFQESRNVVESLLRKREAKKRWEVLRRDLLEKAHPMYDFKALRNPKVSSEGVVLRWNHGKMRKVDVVGILGRSSHELSRLSENQIRKILSERIIAHMAAEKAREEGLDSSNEIRARLRWAEQEVPAACETERRISELFRPPTQAEVDRAIATMPSQYRHPPEFNLSLIRLEGEGSKLRERYREAEKIVSKLKSGELNFQESVGQFSAELSKARVNDLGWLSLPKLLSLGSVTAMTIQDMKRGEIRGPIQQRDGSLLVIFLRDRHKARAMETSEARSLAFRRLEKHQRKTLARKIRQEILARFHAAEEGL